MVVFAVGGLPQEKVADAEFAAGADYQIGVGAVGGEQAAAEPGFIQILGGHALPQQFFDRRQNFLAAAVVKGQVEDDAGVFLGLFLGQGDGLTQGGGKAVGGAEVVDADVFFAQ